MVVYVGPAATAMVGVAHRMRRVRVCTVTADTPAELYDFARLAGMSRSRIRDAITRGYYDIPATARAAAIGLGAAEIGDEELGELARRAQSWSDLPADRTPGLSEPTSGRSLGGVIHELAHRRYGQLYALCGAEVADEVRYDLRSNCPNCAAALAAAAQGTTRCPAGRSLPGVARDP